MVDCLPFHPIDHSMTHCIVSYLLSTHLYSAFRSAHQSEALPPTCLGGANEVVLQTNCVRRIFSRSLHSNYLGRGSNPYSPRYRPSTLTDRPPLQHIRFRKVLQMFYFIQQIMSSTSNPETLPNAMYLHTTPIVA